MHIVPLFNQRSELAYFAAIERDVTSLKDKGLRILNQFREKVANAALTLNDGTVQHLTVSVGLATRLPGQTPTCSSAPT